MFTPVASRRVVVAAATIFHLAEYVGDALASLASYFALFVDLHLVFFVVDQHYHHHHHYQRFFFGLTLFYHYFVVDDQNYLDRRQSSEQ